MKYESLNEHVRSYLEQEFEKNLEKKGDHLIWIGGTFKTTGDGRIKVLGKSERVSRIYWLLTEGFIPPGRYVFIGCEENLCVAHLTMGKKSAYFLKTHCNNGHELTEDNIYSYPQRGQRICITCAKKRAIKKQAQRKTAILRFKQAINEIQENEQ